MVCRVEVVLRCVNGLFRGEVGFGNTGAHSVGQFNQWADGEVQQDVAVVNPTAIFDNPGAAFERTADDLDFGVFVSFERVLFHLSNMQ